MTPARQAGDNRRRVLSHDEMQLLAALHHRVIAVVPISDADRIAELERKIEELLARIEAMETARSRLLVMDSDEMY